MLKTITENYGLLGGQLDATKHFEAVLPRLLRGEELGLARDQLAVLAQTSRERASSTAN